MSTAAHTPGLWIAEQVTERRGWKVYRDVTDGLAVCQLFDKNNEPFSNDKANARLIAAAPDLLAVLKMLRDIDDAYGFDLNEQQRDQMHDALAKAEGRS